MEAQEQLNEMIAKARVAQQEFEKYPQEKVDAAVRAIGKAVYDHAEELANLAVEETRMGKVESKIAKCRNKTKSTWWRMNGTKSRGIIERDEETGIVKVAKPIGVVGCVTATTNPVINPMHNSMCALKCGNAVIISPHPRAKKVGARTVELMNEALDALGMPKNLIQIIEEPTMELSAGLMKSAARELGRKIDDVLHHAGLRRHAASAPCRWPRLRQRTDLHGSDDRRSGSIPHRPRKQSRSSGTAHGRS